jgi:hypothetical protein
MISSHYRPYGFTYDYDGRKYAFDILATSLGEAQGRAASMASAAYVGELCRSESVIAPRCASPYASLASSVSCASEGNDPP